MPVLAGAGAGAGAGGSSPELDAGMARDASSPPACNGCEVYADPVVRANVQVDALDALSGAAASVRNPGVLFAHNDRNRPVVYALDEQGALLARLTLADTSVADIEDMAVGPCPQGSCVYVADIGDNAAVRGEYALLRFGEPAIARGSGMAELDVEIERFRFEYEDGSHNAEGLLVEPQDGTVYIVTKVAAGQPSSVYRLPPLDASMVQTATKAADLEVPAAGDMPASAAAAHPCGLGFAIRTYNALYEFRIAEGIAFEEAFRVTPTPLAAPDEPQSEALTYLPDGRGLVSAGEGAASPIYQLLCP
jgi:hypothetical protein